MLGPQGSYVDYSERPHPGEVAGLVLQGVCVGLINPSKFGGWGMSPW
jgi:hypothetical protein